MPAAPPLPIHLLKVIWKYTSAVGHECRNIQYYELPAGFPTNAQLDAYSDLLFTKLYPILSVDSHYEGVDLYVGTGSDPGFASSTSSSGVGSRTNPMSAPQVQQLIKKTGETAGRHNRGRTYLPDVQESDVDNMGVLSSAALGRLQDLADIMLTDLPHCFDVACFPVMYDVKNAQLNATLTAFTAEQKVATQRRRFRR